MKITVLGSRGYIKEVSPEHRKRTGVLFEHNSFKLLIDCGDKSFLQSVPNAIVLTHGHPDHIEGLRDGTEIPIYTTRDTQKNLKQEKILEKLKVVHLIKKRGSFKVGPFTLESYPVLHSTLAPTVAYKVKTPEYTFFQATDIVWLKNKTKVLSDVSFWIADGSSIKGLVRKIKGELIGHTSITAQIAWGKIAKVSRIMFTHFGTPLVKMEQKKLTEKITSFAPEGIQVDCAYDGLVVDLEEKSKLESKKYLLAQHRRDQCMECKKPPVYEVLWAEGMAHAWFCKEHFEEWAKKHLRECKAEGFAVDIDEVKEVKDGIASKKFRDNPNPNIWRRLRVDLVSYIGSKEGKEFDLFHLETYDPSKANDEQLRDDVRLALGKYATMKRGGKSEFSSLDEVVDFVCKVMKEVMKREIDVHYRPERMKPYAAECFRKVIVKLEYPPELVTRAGIYLVTPHAEWIAQGKKKAILSTVRSIKYIDTPVFVLQDNNCYGIIQLSTPEKISWKSFGRRFKEHKISDDEAERWGWKKYPDLYLQKVKVLKPLKHPWKFTRPRKVQKWIKTVNFEEFLGEVKISTDIDVGSLSRQELMSLHNSLHECYHGKIPAGLSLEDLLNLHQQVVEEMLCRSIPHEVKDGLDKGFKKLPIKKSEEHLEQMKVEDFSREALGKIDTDKLLSLHTEVHEMGKMISLRNTPHEFDHNDKISTGLSLKEAKQIKDFEYLLHHVEVDDAGKEHIHHCLVYDHIGNMFEQGHLTIKNGKVYLNDKLVTTGTFHTLIGLEKTQDVVWSDDEAKKHGIKPKQMRKGMNFKEKAKEW